MFKTTRSAAPSLDDEEILKREAEWARQAMAEARARLQQGLVKAADPTAWARKHPLATVGVAAAAGFLTARAVNTSREEKIVLRYWKAMRAGTASSSAGAERAAATTRRGGIAAGLMSVVKTAVAQLPTILSQLQAHSAMEQKEAARQDAAAQAAAAPFAPQGSSYEPPIAEPVNGY